jgi:DNA-binding NarL/FixJ family response regulator
MAETRSILTAVLEDDHLMQVVALGETGEDAIQIYDAIRPDVLLMCVRMFKMDGLTATRLIREKHPDARVVILTVGGEGFEERAFEAGAAAFVQKPPTRDTLIEVILNAAGRR